MKSAILQIKIRENCINKEDVLKYYTSKAGNFYEGDSGIDLISPCDFIFPRNTVTKYNLGISCKMIYDNEPTSYSLIPRSSISNTPLMLANSVGLIDAGYRGEIMAAFRCFDDPNIKYPFEIKAQSRLLQIIHPLLVPIKVEIVDELDKTERGENGFGSTDNK